MKPFVIPKKPYDQWYNELMEWIEEDIKTGVVERGFVLQLDLAYLLEAWENNDYPSVTALKLVAKRKFEQK